MLITIFYCDVMAAPPLICRVLTAFIALCLKSLFFKSSHIYIYIYIYIYEVQTVQVQNERTVATETFLNLLDQIKSIFDDKSNVCSLVIWIAIS